MIPVRAHSPVGRRPVVTWLLAAACAGILVRLAMQPAADAASIVTALAVVPARLLADPWSAQAVTLVSATFLHAGWVHLAGNLLYLLVFGPAVESRLGHRAFLMVYLAAGAVGALTHTLLHPSSAVPLVGASGAIAGVLGAHLVLEPRTKVTTIVPAMVVFEIAALPAAFVIALWFLAQLASGLAPVATQAEAASVAWFAHVGGFAAGSLLAAPIALRDLAGTTRRARSRRSGAGAGETRRRNRAA